MLTETELDCLDRYCALLAARLPDLGNETYPLYLECGRQLSPQLIARERVAAPADERMRAFLAQVEAEGVDVWSSR